MDIIVTTPKSQMEAAAQEARDCIAAGGGEYFRRFPRWHAPNVQPGERVYYVEDGYVRGFAVVTRVKDRKWPQECATTGYVWPPGLYVYMAAQSWQWINPIPMQGFQGFRYAFQALAFDGKNCGPAIGSGGKLHRIYSVGGWRDPKPEVRP